MKNVQTRFIALLSLFSFTFMLPLNAQKSLKTVKIGTQGMDENLDVDTFRNGDTIPEAKSDSAWQKASKEGKAAWCYYDNNPKNGRKYGKLYDWYAVNDPRGLAPKGYHVPTKAEWDSLVSYLRVGEIAGGIKLKSKKGWLEEGNGSNESGFSGLPGGRRSKTDYFENVGEFGF